MSTISNTDNDPDAPDAEVSRIADEIVSLVEQEDCLTFTELDQRIEGFRSSVDLGWSFGCGQLQAWAGMSDAGVLALERLVDQRRIAFAPSSAMTYAFHGGRVPVFDKSWIPMVLRPARYGELCANGFLMVPSPEVGLSREEHREPVS